MRVIEQSAKVMEQLQPMKHIERIGRVCYKSEDRIGDGTDRRFVKMLYDHHHHAMLEHYRFIMEVPPVIYELLSKLKLDYFEFTNDERFVISFNARALFNMVQDSHCEQFGITQMSVTGVRDELVTHIIDKYKCYELFGYNEDGFTRNLLSTGVEFIPNNPDFMTEREWKTHGWASVHMITDRGISHEIVRHRPASFAQESTRYCNYSKGKFGNEICVINPRLDRDDAIREWEYAMEQAEDAYLGLLNHGVSPEFARTVLPTSLKTDIVMTATMSEWEHFFDLRYRGVTGTPHPMIAQLSGIIVDEMENHAWNVVA